MKKAYVSMLPKGSIWNVGIGSDLDKEIIGLAENFERVRQFLEQLQFIRDPEKTILLDDLEIEFGIAKDEDLTEEVRRQQLATAKYKRNSNGSEDVLQDKLRNAGFDVFVYQNDPAVDPSIFLENSFRMFAGGPNAFAGNEEAIAGISEGELLVNGDIFISRPLYLAQAGGPSSFAGNSIMLAGKFDEIETVKIEYKTPTNPNAWPFIFFVGGVETRDIDGSILDIERAEIPIERRDEFIRIILKYKPLDTWGTLVVIYT